MATTFNPRKKKHLIPLLLLLLSLSFFTLLLFSSNSYTTAAINTDIRSGFLRNSGNGANFTLLIKVLTYNRLHALSRCLRSLAAADYSSAAAAGRQIHLHVYIDHFSLSLNDTPVEDRLASAREILEFVDGFEWRFGEKFVHYRTDNVGLQAQWLEAWWPGSDSEFAFVVEDDLEVSPLYYKFLESVIVSYCYNSSNFSPFVYGASLQRPRFVPGRHGNKLDLDPETRVFLYQLVGTWGQLLFPKPWKEFRLWYDDHKGKGIKPFLDGMVTTGWYKKIGERIWTPWFIKFIHSRGYFNFYTNFQHERALSVSHRDAGVNYGKTVGPDSQLLDATSTDSNFLKMPPLKNLKWFDFCFREVLPGRVVRNLDELGTVLPSVERQRSILLVGLYNASETATRNLLCHFERLNTRNYILVGPNSDLLYDLSRRGHPVIDADLFLDSIGEYKLEKTQNFDRSAVKEILTKAHVIKKCLESGYNCWAVNSNILFVSENLLLHSVSSSNDFYVGESSALFFARHSSAAQKFWTNEFLLSVADVVNKDSSPGERRTFVHVVTKLLEQKGGKISRVDETSLGVNIGVNGVNQSLAEEKKMVYWSSKIGFDFIQKQLEELNMWLIDGDSSCKAVVCHQS